MTPLREILRYRALILHLALVNFRIRYQSAVLGIGWSLAGPLALFVVFAFVFQPIFDIRVPHYAVFLLCGLFPWAFLAGAVGETIHTLPQNCTFIKAYRFPREVLPLAGALTHLGNLGLALAMVWLWAALGAVGPRADLVWLPLVLLLLFLFAGGLCLAFSALDACYKDVSYLVDVAMLAWFYLPPVFYPVELAGRHLTGGGLKGALGLAIQWNPMTALIEGVRASVLGTPRPGLLYPATVSLAVFAGGLALFRRLEPRYVDVL